MGDFRPLLLLVPGLAGCFWPSEEPARLQVIISGTKQHPATRVRLVGGRGNPLVLDGAQLRATSPTSAGSDPITMDPATAWPFRVAVLSAAGDTIGAATATVGFETDHLTTVILAVLPTREGIFFCSPILTRAPLSTTAGAQDTLWVASWGPVAPDQPPPVC